MKATFNGLCDRCKWFRPQCARVHYRLQGAKGKYTPAATVLCGDCRKAQVGQYKVASEHRE